MLNHLYISNYAIINEITIHFAKGLNTITGETGAGKSIMAGALNLILGERADSSVLHNQDENCIVEGHFEIGRYHLQHVFTNHDIEYEDIMIVRRIIYSNGKSRAFINDEPTTLVILKDIMQQLVQQHRQFDTLDLNSKNYQLSILDAMADHRHLLDSYKRDYKTYKNLHQKLKDLQEQESQAIQEKDFITFQLNELLELDLKKNEAEEIQGELEQLVHAEEIKAALSNTLSSIENDQHSIPDLLRELSQQLSRVSHIFKPAQLLSERIISVQIELDDIVSEASELSDDINYDQEKIDTLRTRLNHIFKLFKKHHVDSSEELLLLQNQLSNHLQGIESISNEIESYKKEMQLKFEEVITLGNKIRENRIRSIPSFTEQVEKKLAQIAMPHARLIIKLHERDTPSEQGVDEVEYLFSANVGSPPTEISQVASGGELSRLALAIKSIVAQTMTLPTLIFDEIDQGVSGDISLKMGHMLRNLSERHQVIVITHSAQIAAQGEQQFFVYKNVEKNRTFTHVRLLEEADRIHHIAVMLSQDPPTEAAINNAKELLHYTEN